MSNTELETVRGGKIAKALIDHRSDLLEMVPDHIDGERFLRVLTSEIKRNPALKDCSLGSLFDCAVEAARLGLDVGAHARQFHMVPFKVKGQMTATPIIDYRGLIALAMQNGAASVSAELVHDSDSFTMLEQDGATYVEHRFNPLASSDDRGRVVGGYCKIVRDNGTVRYATMTREDIDQVRNASRAKNAMAWSDWWGEMAKKTIIRRALKTENLNPATRAFIAKADEAEIDFGNRRTIDARPGSADDAFKAPALPAADEGSIGVTPEASHDLNDPDAEPPPEHWERGES
tara:strand:+ start:107 stop:976 length:870 start_codon:yes stop_codon:yes gene_type:complete